MLHRHTQYKNIPYRIVLLPSNHIPNGCIASVQTQSNEWWNKHNVCDEGGARAEVEGTREMRGGKEKKHRNVNVG